MNVTELVRKVGRFRALSPGEKSRLLLSAVLLLGLKVGVVAASFSRVRETCLRSTAVVEKALPIPGSPPPQGVAWAVAVADRNVPGSRKCLVRSLTTEVLLRLFGHRPVHRIGVRTDSEEFRAHSWLEYEGEILIGDLADLDRYDPLPPLEDPVES